MEISRRNLLKLGGATVAVGASIGSSGKVTPVKPVAPTTLKITPRGKAYREFLKNPKIDRAITNLAVGKGGGGFDINFDYTDGNEVDLEDIREGKREARSLYGRRAFTENTMKPRVDRQKALVWKGAVNASIPKVTTHIEKRGPKSPRARRYNTPLASQHNNIYWESNKALLDPTDPSKPYKIIRNPGNVGNPMGTFRFETDMSKRITVDTVQDIARKAYADQIKLARQKISNAKKPKVSLKKPIKKRSLLHIIKKVFTKGRG